MVVKSGEEGKQCKSVSEAPSRERREAHPEEDTEWKHLEEGIPEKGDSTGEL